MKKYIVIGAAKPGIGEAITRRIIDEGHYVIGTYDAENSDLANDLRHELKNIELIELNHDSVVELDKFIAVVPCGIQGVAIPQMYFHMGNAENFELDTWNQSLAVNFTMPHRLTLGLATKMPEGGAFATITSTEGFVGSFGAASYAATKAAMHNLVKTHANIFGPKGVRVNAIAAGWIGGVMDTDDVFNMSRKITPLRRLGTADEVANVVWFLINDQSSFITGATIVVDGGYTCVDSISKFEYEAFVKEGN